MNNIQCSYNHTKSDEFFHCKMPATQIIIHNNELSSIIYRCDKPMHDTPHVAAIKVGE